MQDMTNALKLLQNKANKLRERLKIAENELQKVTKCGQEMDGNTSNIEEEDFITTINDEMPDVFKNISLNLK